MPDRGSNLPTTYFCKIKGYGKQLFQLVTNTQSLDGETEKNSLLKRETLGEKNEKTHKTILLVGETGTGKSSLINAMANYVMGVRFHDKIRYSIVKDQETSQSKSQTSAVTVYTIFTHENSSYPYNLSIIDTPGYGDTRGLDHDRALPSRLLDLFRCNNGIHELNAVGFVMKATQNRLHDRQRYIFDAVLDLFSKDMKKNIVALLTHSDGGPATNAIQALKDAKIPCSEDEDGDPVHFLFNNREPEVTTEKNKVKEERALSNAWETSNDGMKELFEFLDKTPPRQLATTVDVLNRRVHMEALVTNYQEQIKYIEMKQTERRKVEEALEKHKEACSVTVDEPYKEKAPVYAWWFNKAVCCTVCEENCHYPGCTIAATPWWCEVMRNDHCTSCTGRCHYTKHVRENWRYVSKTRKVTKNYADLLKDYAFHEKELSKVGEKETLLNKVKRSIEEAGVKKSLLVEDSYQNVLKLQEIALRGGSLSTCGHLDFLIQKLKETGEPDRHQKLQKLMKIKEQIEEEDRK